VAGVKNDRRVQKAKAEATTAAPGVAVPVMRGRDERGPFYRSGDGGERYRYTVGDPSSRQRARDKALQQGSASKSKAPARSELHFFDFDGTLFRSPQRPEGFDGDWWNSSASLGPPYVPKKPGSDWWVGSTVTAAKKSIANPKILAVMMTARSTGSDAGKRIAVLLRQRGLAFDEVHLSPAGESKAAKRARIRAILRRHPEIDRVRFWDDKGDDLRSFADVAKKQGIDGSRIDTNLVKTATKNGQNGPRLGV
jgi:hypothetical protein